MIGKITKGRSFSGCVNYVLKEAKSRLLEAVGVDGSPSEMAEQFELQTLLNEKVKNTVGHISLNFSAEDAVRLATDDKLMLKIAHDYMKLMVSRTLNLSLPDTSTATIRIATSSITEWIRTGEL